MNCLCLFECSFIFFTFSDYYRVRGRSFEDWHSLCFKERRKPHKSKLVELCGQLGYPNITEPAYQLFYLNEEQSSSPFELFATNMVTSIKLNDNFELKLYTTRKLTGMKRIKDKNCTLQLDLNCGPNN